MVERNIACQGQHTTQVLAGPCINRASYGLVIAKHGTGSSSSSKW